jgi:trigger factor
MPPQNKTKALAGQELEFKVTVHTIREVILPEVNDEFAQEIAYTTLDDLRERIRYNLRKEKEQKEETEYKERVVETVIAKSRIEYPPRMVEIQTRLLAREYYQQLKDSSADEKVYEEKEKMIPAEKVKESLEPLARKRVLWSLVLDEVAKYEKIVATDDEITSEIDAQTQGLDVEQRRKARRYFQRTDRQNVEDIVRASKTVNRLAEIVKNNETNRPKVDKTT